MDKQVVSPPTPLVDNAPLIEMTREFISTPARNFLFHPYDRGAEAARLGFRSIRSNEKKAFIVTAEETALELGSPRHVSLAALMWTMNEGVITEGVWTSGIGFKKIKEPRADLILAVMTQVPRGFDPGDARFRGILNLSNRIPGYMARSVPGKLWIRISRGLIDSGFSPVSLGQCLVYAFHDAVPGLGPVAAIVAAGDGNLTRDFAPIHGLERAYSGKNRKLSLEASGVLECADLNCSSCDEKPSCDTIREVMTIKKSRKDNTEP
jgi:hypothetical protein